jgi:Transposase, Mutator family
VAVSELDATYLKQREGGRIVSVAAIIAVAVNTDGRREIVGLHIGPSEAKTFWLSFLKSLARRGLRGIKLVISDGAERRSAEYRRLLATLPRALDAQRSGLCAEDPAEHGSGGAAPALPRLSRHMTQSYYLLRRKSSTNPERQFRIVRSKQELPFAFRE